MATIAHLPKTLVVGSFFLLSCAADADRALPIAAAPVAASAPVVVSPPSTPSAAASAPLPLPSALPAPPPDPSISAAEAIELLFPTDDQRRAEALTLCPDAPRVARIECLLQARYAEDAQASQVALDLYRQTGAVAGLDVDHVMDGGYRGMLHLVPDLPIGAKRFHLLWVRDALVAARDFVAAVEAKKPGSDPVRFRVGDLKIKFFRSVKARTPSAYADGFTLAYNTAGSLNTSGPAVRDTFFHELYHSNDADHDEFSVRSLSTMRDAIVARCGASTPCLTPYAPTDTVVRGGTYYAFQPGNDVREYGAEVASRYFSETREFLAGKKPKKKLFRCGPKENADAFVRVANEMFGGFVAGPPCDGP